MRNIPVLCLLFVASCLGCQSQTHAAVNAAKVQTEPIPTTKMEAFHPVEGSVVTLGYDEIPTGVRKVTLDARQLKSSDGSSVKGMKIEISEGDYKQEAVFIDMDELPELIHAIDVLAAISSNPTQSTSFEVRYTSRGSLQLTAFNQANGQISYAIQVGRITKAQTFTEVRGMQSLKQAFMAARLKLDTLPK
jgi:hypothetical protein